MKTSLLFLIPMLLFTACEPRDIRLLQDSERSKKGFYSREGQEVFFGETSAAIFALEKQVEIINALEMAIHHEAAESAGFVFTDESHPSRKNATPAFVFHQYQSLSSEKTRQESFGQWRASVTGEPLVLQAIGNLSLYLLPLPDAKTQPGPAPVADVKTNIEQAIVEVSGNPADKDSYNIEIKMMKITLTKELAKPFLAEINITSKLTVRRNSGEVGQPATYTILKSDFSLSNNKVRNGIPVRTLSLSVPENFIVHLGACPFVEGTLSLGAGDLKRELVQFKQDSILNLKTNIEDKLIPCSESGVRPLVDLSRILRM